MPEAWQVVFIIPFIGCEGSRRVKLASVLSVLLVSITVLFFSSLRDQIGYGSAEVSKNDLSTVWDVWRTQTQQEPDATVRAAVNGRYAPFDTLIEDGDEIAFFPPVTGG